MAGDSVDVTVQDDGCTAVLCVNGETRQSVSERKQEIQAGNPSRSISVYLSRCDW